MFFPRAKLVRGYRKGEMQRAMTVVGTERAKRQLRDAIRRPPLEERQNTLVGHAVGAQAVITKHFCEGEYAFIKARCAIEVVDVNRSFEHAGEGRHARTLPR